MSSSLPTVRLVSTPGPATFTVVTADEMRGFKGKVYCSTTVDSQADGKQVLGFHRSFQSNIFMFFYLFIMLYCTTFDFTWGKCVDVFGICCLTELV